MSTAAPLRSQPAKSQPTSNASHASLLLQRKCACGSPTASLTGECEECASKKRLQTKLTIGASNDPLELEADRVADQVMAAPAYSPVRSALPRIQRYTAQSSATAGVVPASVDRVLASPGRPLDPVLRQDMEHRFGHDFSRVRVYSDSAAGQSARDVSAIAYTVGHQIVFGASRFSPSTQDGRRLVAHELSHVVQQCAAQGEPAGGHGRLASIQERHPVTLARTPIDPPKTAQEVVQELQDMKQDVKEKLLKLVKSLPPETQAHIDRNSTLLVALIEVEDESGNPFRTMVFTPNRKAKQDTKLMAKLMAAADKLDIPYIGDVLPRAEGRGETGAPLDAEQMASEAKSEFGIEILVQAVTRRPCVDCAEMIKDEEIVTTWLDPAERKSAFGAGRLYKRGSSTLKKAVSELELAVTVPGQEGQSGLGPEASVWLTLNGLDIRELYKVFGLLQQQGRLNIVQERAQKAKGIYNDRLLAVAAALQYKRQLQSPSPTDLGLMGADWAFRVASEKLPSDQLEFLQRQLRPPLRSIVKQKAHPKPETKRPVKEEPKETAASEIGYTKLVKAALIAAGLVIAAPLLLELAEAIASAVFFEVILAAAAQALKGAAADKVKEVVVREVGKRVAGTGPEQMARIADTVAHKLQPIVEPIVETFGKAAGAAHP